MPLEYAHVNSTVTNQLPVLYTTRHLPVRNRISAIMSGEMHVTGPPEIEDDLRPFDVTPYSGTWWAGSPLPLVARCLAFPGSDELARTN